MPTDKERSEVAQALRKVAARNPALDCSLRESVFKTHDCRSYRTCRECLEDAYNRLADLIEPETCQIEYDTVLSLIHI